MLNEGDISFIIFKITTEDMFKIVDKNKSQKNILNIL